MYRFSAFPLRIKIAFFREIEQVDLTFSVNHKSLQIEEKKKNGGIKLHDFKLPFQYGTGTKQGTSTIRKNEKPRNSSINYEHLTYGKIAETNNCRKENLFSK